MSYNLQFLPSALKEWRKVDPDLKAQFKAQLQRRLERPHVDRDPRGQRSGEGGLQRRLERPHVDSARIRGHKNHYKLKLRSAGYRLVYEVEEKTVTVCVICIGKRDTFYRVLRKRKARG